MNQSTRHSTSIFPLATFVSTGFKIYAQTTTYCRLLAMFHKFCQIEYGLSDLRNGITGKCLLEIDNQILLVDRPEKTEGRREREKEHNTVKDGQRDRHKREKERYVHLQV